MSANSEANMLIQEKYESMRIEKNDSGVTVVTLNRPERLNAVNGVMHRELSTFSRDADVAVSYTHLTLPTICSV